MAAQIARHLHQSLNEVEKWRAAKFLAYHAALAEMVSAENEGAG